MKYGYARVSTVAQEGKARNDFREGRPRKHSKQQVEHALKLLETNTYKQVEAMTGINRRTFIRRKNEQLYDSNGRQD